ncbi:hypothetical protein AN221_23710 [Streptomyces nanshensis]|uniref:Uncharacterized protein n=2 Tax=Streptomyces TaxID=1883 RepID=A0A1E7LPM0_9ACTN|nr:hypothetical protein AN221_23710 [Streptomyces nanshensis]
MRPVVRFPDVEALTLHHLRKVIPGFQGGPDIPQDLASRLPFTMVERNGGVTRWPALDQAVLALYVYGADRATAHDRLQEVLAHLHAMPGSAPLVSRTYTIAGAQFTPDPLTDGPRWYASVGVAVRPEKGIG